MAAVAGRGESRLRALGRRALEEEAFRRTLQEQEAGERAALDQQEAAFQRRMSGLAAKCATLLDPVVLPVRRGPDPREKQRPEPSGKSQQGRLLHLAPPPPPPVLRAGGPPAPPGGQPASQVLPKTERPCLWESPPPPPAPRREEWDAWPEAGGGARATAGAAPAPRPSSPVPGLARSGRDVPSPRPDEERTSPPRASA